MHYMRLKLHLHLHLIKKCHKGSHMDSWEALYMYIYHKQRILIDEQQVTETNDIFDLAVTTPDIASKFTTTPDIDSTHS